MLLPRLPVYCEGFLGLQVSFGRKKGNVGRQLSRGCAKLVVADEGVWFNTIAVGLRSN